jgi:hypothetical protein
VSDQASVTDSPAVQYGTYLLSVSDTVSTTDSESIVREGETAPLNVSISDAIAATESKDARKISTTFDDAVRSDIILGLISAQSEAHGWNADVRAALLADVSVVVRSTSNIVTVTLPAVAAYNITAQETITGYVPSSAVTAGVPITASPTFAISEVNYLSVSKSDSVALSESRSIVREGPLEISASDSAAVTDRVLTWSEWSEEWEFTTADLHDHADITEYVNVVREGEAAALSVSKSDTVAVTESEAARLDKLLASLYDSAYVTDSTADLLDKILVSLSDSVAILESVAASSGNLFVAEQDQTAVTDSVAASLNLLNVLTSDQVAITESVADRLDKLLVSLADSIDMVETVNRVIEDQATRTVNESDTSAVSDATAIALNLLIVSVSDVAAATEQVTREILGGREVSKSDEVTLSDSASVRLNVLNVSTSDAVASQDSATAMLDALNVLAEEVAAVSDAAYRLIDTITLSVPDAAFISDLVAASLYYTLYTVSTSDGVGMEEGATVHAMQSPHGAKPRGGKSHTAHDRNTGDVKSSWRNTNIPRNRYRGN